MSSTPTVSFTSLNNIMGNLFLNYLYFKIILRLLLYLRKHKQSMFTQCILSLFLVLLNASPPLLCAFIHCNQHCAFVFRNSPISPFVRTHNRSLKNLERILSTQRNNWISPYQSAHCQDYPIQPVLAVGVYLLSGRGLWGPLLWDVAAPAGTGLSPKHHRALNESKKYLPPKHWETNPKIARTVFLSLSPIISQPTVQTMV